MNREFLSTLLKDVDGADGLIDKIMSENGKDIESNISKYAAEDKWISGNGYTFTEMIPEINSLLSLNKEDVIITLLKEGGVF